MHPTLPADRQARPPFATATLMYLSTRDRRRTPSLSSPCSLTSSLSPVILVRPQPQLLLLPQLLPLLQAVTVAARGAPRPGKVTKPLRHSSRSFSYSFLLVRPSFLPPFIISLFLSMDIDFSSRMYPPRDGRFLTCTSIDIPSHPHLAAFQLASL